MSSCKVFVKTSENSNLCTKENLLVLLSSHSIKIIKLLTAGSNFSIICSDTVETEKLFRENVISSLGDSGFSPVLPGELKSSRSVILRKVDPHIYRNTPDSIKQELMRCNSWCQVTEVIKFESSFKVVFTSTEMAEKSVLSGLLLFYLHIPGHYIIRDKFVTLLTCYSCFDIENHIASNCPKKLNDPSFQVCSKCAATDHSFKSCPNKSMKLRCYTCDGEHHAMSNSCPIHREALRKKRMNNNSGASFSDKVRSTIPTNRSNLVHSAIDVDICLLYTSPSPRDKRQSRMPSSA